jgi:hypothetical protein
MNEAEAHALVRSAYGPIDAAEGLLRSNFVSLLDHKGRWLRIEFTEGDFGPDQKARRIPQPKSDPLAEQFDALMKRGELVFQSSSDLADNLDGWHSVRHGTSEKESLSLIESSMLANAAARRGARIVGLTEKGKYRWHKNIEDAWFKACRMIDDHHAGNVIREMVVAQFGIVAIAEDARTGAAVYERRSIRRDPLGCIAFDVAGTVSESRKDEVTGAFRACEMGLVAEVLLDGCEAFLLTTAGYELAGATPGPQDVVAPSDWKRTMEERKRVSWTPVAEQQGIVVAPRIIRPWQLPWIELNEEDGIEPALGWSEGDIVVSGGSSTVAVQRPGEAFQWERRHSTAADPFTRNDYLDVDELVADLVSAGRHVTDLRRCVEDVSEIERATELLTSGFVAQTVEEDVVLLLPRVNGVHGDLRRLPHSLLRTLVNSGTVVSVPGVETPYYREELYAHPSHKMAAGHIDHNPA